MARITVIGAGATGLAACAHLSLAGHSLHLLELPGHEQNISALRESRTIHFTGSGFDEKVRVDSVSSNAEAAFRDAELAIVAAVAQRHEQIAERCLPLMSGIRAVLITPGNLGSLVFSRVAGKIGADLPPIAEVESNLHVARRSGPASVELILPPRPRYVAALPATNTRVVIDAFARCYQLEPARNIFETTLNLPNLDSHLPGMLLNAGLIEHPEIDFHFYRDGLGTAARSVMEAQFREKVTVMQALGLEVRSRIELLEMIADKEDARFESFRNLPGPESMSHRFLSEDAFAGTCFLVSLADQLGIDVPVARSLLKLASVVSGEDFFRRGRTLENLGLDGLSEKKMVAYLETGKQER